MASIIEADGKNRGCVRSTSDLLVDVSILGIEDPYQCALGRGRGKSVTVLRQLDRRESIFMSLKSEVLALAVVAYPHTALLTVRSC